jgi:hypothetical protein
MALPDLEQSKAAVLKTHTSKSGQRSYDRAVASRIVPPIPVTSAHPVARRMARRNLTCQAIVLHGHGTIVIMNVCKLSSRRRVVTTACAVLLTRGIAG